MVYYINNFKSLNGLTNKRTEIITNIFKLVHNAEVNVHKEYINNEWKLTITVMT